MTIIRTASAAKPYFMLRREAAQDEALTWEARGLLCYLMSLPADWAINMNDLAQRSPSSKGRVYRIIRDELEPLGYLTRVQTHTADGKMGPMEYIATDERAPCDEKPHTVKPQAVKRDAYREDIVQTRQETVSTPQQAVFGALCEWIGIDPAASPSKATQANIGSLAAIYVKAGEGPEAVEEDARKWWRDDWRGQDKKPPTVRQAQDWRASCRAKPRAVAVNF